MGLLQPCCLMSFYNTDEDDVLVRAVWEPENFGVAADHVAIKLFEQKPEVFERSMRRASILHPPIAIPPLLLGLLSASLHDCYLGCRECFGASWGGEL